MDRRSFLRGALSLAVVPAVARLKVESLPVIVGDGVFDDAPGLNALFSGKSVIIENSAIIASGGHLEGGTFGLASPLVLRGQRFQIERCTFKALANWSGDYMLSLLDGADGSISNMTIDASGLGGSLWLGVSELGDPVSRITVSSA